MVSNVQWLGHLGPILVCFGMCVDVANQCGRWLILCFGFGFGYLFLWKNYDVMSCKVKGINVFYGGWVILVSKF